MLTEEVLLEALCFDFVVDCPHTDLVDIFASRSDNQIVQEYAWSIAHDSSVLRALYIHKLLTIMTGIERHYVCCFHRKSSQVLVIYMRNVWRMGLNLHLLMSAFQHQPLLNN